jgi:hypothetical protein|tara:strand:+ start:6245 stop:6346 length:102 start_codon:yes stop_codon:yes gene_type:complete
MPDKDRNSLPNAAEDCAVVTLEYWAKKEIRKKK